MRLDRADEITFIPDIKYLVAQVSQEAGSPYKLTPHFTEGSSLISSRFFPPYSAPCATRHFFKFHPNPASTWTPRGEKQATPRYCSLISPVVLRRLTTAANSYPRNHLRPILHPGCPLVPPILGSLPS